MANTLMLVFSSPGSSPEQEAAYNEWYTNVHLLDVTGVPGVVAATRYKVADANADGVGHRYLAIYEIEEGVDPATVQASLGAAVRSGEIRMVKGLGGSSTTAFWHAISGRVENGQPAPSAARS